MAQALGKSKLKATVICAKHGIEGKLKDIKIVKVGMPNGKNQRRFGGCPICKRDSVQE